ncbi:MAG: hypothetical protein IKV69_01285 [Clostridia bacterium]|nr:hypothetical protein [Clostridia bacterium]
MIKIDKSTIKNFAESLSDETALNGLGFASTILQSALTNISAVNPYVSQDFEILPLGSFYSGAVLPSSTLELLVVVNNPQIELNTLKLFKNKWVNFKERLKYAWVNRKKKKKKKKRKKKTVEEAPVNLYETHKEDYNLSYFTKDLVHAIAKEITEEDVAFSARGVVGVQGKNVPYKIRIYPVIKKEDSTFLFYAPNKKKLQEIKLDEYFQNINLLLSQPFAETFLKLVVCFKGLYEHLMQDSSKGLFMESLIANLPYSAFENEDIYDNFVFATNYLINTPIRKLFSISSTQKKIFEDNLCQIQYQDINKFFNKLVQGL